MPEPGAGDQDRGDELQGILDELATAGESDMTRRCQNEIGKNHRENFAARPDLQ